MNKTVVWGLVITGVIIVLIYRKKIMAWAKSSKELAAIKEGLISGDGLGDDDPLSASVTMAPNQGDVVASMVARQFKKVSVLDQGTGDFSTLSGGFDDTMMDQLNIASRPATVNDLFSRGTMKMETESESNDMFRDMRNNVFIRDMWGNDCPYGANYFFRKN